MTKVDNEQVSDTIGPYVLGVFESESERCDSKSRTRKDEEVSES